MEKFNLEQKFDAFSEHWQPRIVAELNGQAVKIAKVQGEFVWHQHENEDELFYVLKGRLKMEFRDREVWIEPGEMLVVPRGVEHRPVAPEEVHLVMFEPTETLNTGNVVNERTISSPDRI